MRSDILNKIREKTDIVELVRKYVPSLRKAGRNYKALCPFHNEKTPSFTVNPEKQIFHCFGCQEGGDIFSFIMKIENLTFMESVKKLAKEAQIKIDFSSYNSSEMEKTFSEIKKATCFAAEFYSRFLTSSNAAEARDYLKKRGISEKILKFFNIGYSPPYSDFLVNEASKKGFSKEILLKAGLVQMRETGHLYDYFRNRIMFPIKGIAGDVIAFGGRILSTGEPKYLNSPETPLFSKRKNFYGLYESLPQIRKIRKIIIMEGYIDIIIAHQNNLNFAVAPLGTALTYEQANIVKRYAEEVILMFDGDTAGRKASIKNGNLLVEAGIYPKVALLPSGEDPDDYLRKRGVRAAIEIIKNAPDLMSFMLDLCAEKGVARAPLFEKSKIISSLLETVARQENEIIKSEWLKLISEKISVSHRALTVELAKIKLHTTSPENNKEKTPEEKIPPIEKGLVQLLLKNPRHINLADKIEESMLESDFAKKIISFMRNLKKSALNGVIAELSLKYPEFSPEIIKISVEELGGDSARDESAIKKTVDMVIKTAKEKKWRTMKNNLDSLSPQQLSEFKKLTKELKT